MTLNEKATLAEALQKSTAAAVTGLWPGFEPVDFILYDGEGRAAAGANWPQEYRRERRDIWVAEGPDPQLMANTAINYHGKMTAIWDLRASVPEPADIAHEMFHVLQDTSLNLPGANELLMPQYPHSTLSVKLVLAENSLCAEILKNPGAVTIGTVKAIAELRELRKNETGTQFMEYDECIEGHEGTAAYIECRVRGNALSYLPPLENPSLSRYRHRCYSAGLALCFAADTLCPSWKTKWPKSGKTLFEWLKETLRLTAADNAEKLLANFNAKKERLISEFKNQPLTAVEGDIQLLLFDPMNLICLNNECLHQQGKIRRNGTELLLDTPFLTETGENILEIKKIFTPA